MAVLCLSSVPSIQGSQKSCCTNVDDVILTTPLGERFVMNPCVVMGETEASRNDLANTTDLLYD